VTKRFEELIGAPEDLVPEERARLRRVHELLLQVPPPPEVPRRLRTPSVVRLRPQHRRWVPALIAAALLTAAFGTGYLAGRNGDPEVVSSISMTGVGEARGAAASIDLLPADDAGNWPMVVRISGLEPNARGGDWYELWLTRDEKLVASCGRFTVDEDETTVYLSVPYRLRGYDGWVVTRRGSDEVLLTT
jgi:hypothetical protein